MLIRLGPATGHASSIGPDSESAEVNSQAASVVLDPAASHEMIEAIRRQVSEHFYLSELCDPGLTVRTNRRAYVFPRQIAMYIARQLTGASLQEIGCEFRNRHRTTVLHSIRRLEKMRLSECAGLCDQAIDERDRCALGQLILAQPRQCRSTDPRWGRVQRWVFRVGRHSCDLGTGASITSSRSG
jgi:hypothetical protein